MICDGDVVSCIVWCCDVLHCMALCNCVCYGCVWWCGVCICVCGTFGVCVWYCKCIIWCCIASNVYMVCCCTCVTCKWCNGCVVHGHGLYRLDHDICQLQLYVSNQTCVLYAIALYHIGWGCGVCCVCYYVVLWLWCAVRCCVVWCCVVLWYVWMCCWLVSCVCCVVVWCSVLHGGAMDCS